MLKTYIPNLITMHFVPSEWWHDVSMWNYTIGLIFAFIGLGFLVWWAGHMRFKASKIYYYLMVLYLGTFTGLGFGWYVRYLKHFDNRLYEEIVSSSLFGYHLFPATIGVTIMTCQLVYQFIDSWRIINGKKKCRRCGKFHTNANNPLHKRCTDGDTLT